MDAFRPSARRVVGLDSQYWLSGRQEFFFVAGK
jgi:hypothetical protein